jgi:hypothetical protein
MKVRVVMAATRCGWFWSFVWILILLVLAWPLGLLAAIFYAMFAPFAACCNACVDLSNFLKKAMEFPYKAGQNIVKGESGC